MEYEIKELPEGLTFETLYDEPLLEYVCEVADKILPSAWQNEYGRILPDRSEAPITFVNRYYSSKNSLENNIEIDNKEIPEFNDYKKEIFLENADLMLTLKAFDLDISKMWYLLLFVSDYVESLYFPEIELSPLEDLNRLLEAIPNMFSLTVSTMVADENINKDRNKHYVFTKKETLEFIKIALTYFEERYNSNINLLGSVDIDEFYKQMSEIGISKSFYHSLELKKRHDEKRSQLSASHKILKFMRIFLLFLENKKAKTNIRKTNIVVSKDKMLLISRLLYTIGSVPSKYNQPGNRYLNNFLRKYAKEEFPEATSIIYFL